MRKLRLTLIVAMLACTVAAMAQTARQELRENPFLAGTNYLAYPGPKKALTPTPKGYEPYYISHYGRHGSRYLIGTSDYDGIYNTLLKADQAGKLTEVGCKTLEKVAMIREEARGRDGELTQLGGEQHKQIARRMYERFPKVFAGNVTVDAKSTVVIRCILSMENALQQLLLLNPKLNVKHDASYHDMYYMNLSDKKLDKLYQKGERSKELREFRKNHMHTDRFMKLIFNDEQYVKDSVKADDTMSGIFKLARNIQSTELRHKFSMYDLFTEDEIYDMWLIDNAKWYATFANSPLSDGKRPFTQRNLLRKIISEADSCLQIKAPGATLRYGHEIIVMPLVCLLDLNGYGKQYDDLEKLAENEWVNYRIFPMACNVQFVFYRPKKPVMASRELNGDVIFKVLLNEEEATLPIQPYQGCYYKWSEFRSYFLEKLNSYEE